MIRFATRIRTAPNVLTRHLHVTARVHNEFFTATDLLQVDKGKKKKQQARDKRPKRKTEKRAGGKSDKSNLKSDKSGGKSDRSNLKSDKSNSKSDKSNVKSNKSDRPVKPKSDRNDCLNLSVKSNGKSDHKSDRSARSDRSDSKFDRSDFKSDRSHQSDRSDRPVRGRSRPMRTRVFSNPVDNRFWPDPSFTRPVISPIDKSDPPIYGDGLKLSKMTLPKSFAVPSGKPVPDHLKPEVAADAQWTFTYNPWDASTETGIISDAEIALEAVNQKGEKPDVLPPTMKHGTDAVLFQNSAQSVRDPRTGVYNFPQYVEDIVPTDELDMDAISGFTPPSQDKTLTKLAQETGQKYFGSTSTLTPLLGQFHNLLSNFRSANVRNTSKWMSEYTTRPTQVYRTPHVAEIHRRGDTYALGIDKVAEPPSLLSKLGHSLEAFLTHTPEEYECLKLNPDPEKVTKQQISEVRSRLDNTYAYSKISKFLTRSQLDCYDSRLPGTGTFDLKTRAVAGTRYDQTEAEMCHGTNYYIHRQFGQYESFEREVFDMSRTVALKYSLQARIGRMDGIYVAYHNMKRFFGFQYFPLEVLDQMNHTAGLELPDNLQQDPEFYDKEITKQHVISMDQGDFKMTTGINPFACVVEDAVESRASAIADKEFRLSMELGSRVLDYVLSKQKDFDSAHQRMVFYADPKQPGRMVVCMGSHDRQEYAYSSAMSLKFHNSLLKHDMESRDEKFDYSAWPWRADEELPKESDSEISQLGLSELAKMDATKYTPDDLMSGISQLWKMSLRDLKVYELHIRNFVNQQEIPFDELTNPCPTKDTEWAVQYRLVSVAADEDQLRNMYIELLERKMRITLLKRGGINDEEEPVTNDFAQVQRMYNRRGQGKLKEIDERAEKLGNDVSRGDLKRSWIKEEEKKEKEKEEVCI